MDTRVEHKPLEGLSILILEDEYLVASAMDEDFRAAGAEITEIARTLAEARASSLPRLDCAVLDLRVPDALAFDLAAELIEGGTPVVFHSGHADIEELTQYKGAVICSKPSLPDELVAAILKARESEAQRGIMQKI